MHRIMPSTSLRLSAMKNHQRLTYSKYSGAIYLSEGSIADVDFSQPVEMLYNAVKVGSLKATPKPFVGTVTEGNEGNYTHTEFKFQASRKAKALLDVFAARKDAMEELYSHDAHSLEAYQAILKVKQLEAAVPGGIGQNEVSPIRVVPLIKRILGIRPNIFLVENGFTPENINKLDARIPEQDTRSGQVQMSPLDKIDFDQLKFSEDRFSLKKNTQATLLPSEASKRADFNIMNLNSTDAMIGFARMRNGQALEALSTIDGTLGGSPSFSINDPEATASSAIPHGAFNVKKEVLALQQAHLDANESIITTMFWNPIDYARWLSNYDVGGFRNANSEVTVSGIVPTAGIPGVMSILDRAVPRGLVYNMDSQAALRGEGPFETEFWREFTRDADAFVMRDYVQFLIPNSKRFGFKMQIAGTLDDVFVPGTEIDTRAKLEAYVRGPQNLLNKAASV